MPSAPRKRSLRRSGAVLVLLSPEEREQIRAAAQRDDRPLTAWMRWVALREAAKRQR